MQDGHAIQRRPALAPSQPRSAVRGSNAESAKLAAMTSALSGSAPVQKLSSLRNAASRPNRTGLPDQLKAGIEARSGISMDAVQVHYNSSRPAQLQARAFAQGTNIHVAPGQERHLPHEAWHVVQQAQGRVRPTMQLKRGVMVNDNPALEREADIMGGLSARHVAQAMPVSRILSGGAGPTAQFVVQLRPSWGEIAGGALLALPTLGIGPAVIAHRYRDRERREQHARLTALAHEAVDGGHSLGRHGPDVSNALLRRRLTTGQAPDGAMSAAPGLSSRFRNHRRWLTTRTASVNELQRALDASRAVVGPSMAALAHGWSAAAAMAPGAAKGAALANVNNALKPAVQAAVNGIANPNFAHQVSLTYHAPAMAGANAANIPQRTENAARIRASYQVVIDHGREVGVGFRGTGVAGPVPGGHAGQVWPTTAAAPVFTSTRTTLAAPGGIVSILAAPAAANWRAVQHFPSTEPPGITG